MGAQVFRSAVINDKGPSRDHARRTARVAFPVEKERDSTLQLPFFREAVQIAHALRYDEIGAREEFAHLVGHEVESCSRKGYGDTVPDNRRYLVETD